MTDSFRKVYCDTCGQKIYLEDFPENWDDLSNEEQNAYMDKQIVVQAGYDSLAAWNRGYSDGPVEEWVTICKRCLVT